MEELGREKELEELFRYYVSSNKTELDMVRWALLNTFKSIYKKLQEGDSSFLTASFIKILKRGRQLLSDEEKELKVILDNILKSCDDKDPGAEIIEKEEISTEEYSKENYLMGDVSRDKELEELLRYYMSSSDKAENDMVRWAILNTFGSLQQKLQERDFGFVTPAFITSLQKAREVLPDEEKELQIVFDNLLKACEEKESGADNKKPWWRDIFSGN